MPCGLVKFGLAGKDLWHRLDRLRADFETGLALSWCAASWSLGQVRRYSTGWVRDSVLLSVG